MQKRLVILGSINADHIIQVPRFAKAGETLLGSGYKIAYGGKGANQAVAAARLGANIDFIGCIGDDGIGQTMKEAFQQDGVNVSGITKIAQSMTGIAMIQVADDGENSIVLAAGANVKLDKNVVVQSATVIEQADALLMQLEIPMESVLTAAKLAKQSQTKVVLNPAPAQILPDELLQQLDMITPNETEAELLTGVKVNDAESAARSAKVFHSKGIHTVLITLGSKGVYFSENGQGQIIPGFRVRATDTTAAGDTFNGALLAALLENQTMSQAIRFAQAAAAISVTRAGAQPSIPYREEVEKFLVNTE